MKTVNILGVEYTIYFDINPDEMSEDSDGCMDQSTRSIKIAKMEVTRNTLQNLAEYQKKVVRHEIIHAFLYESGCWANSGASSAWGRDETVTDWIAIQAPKIFKAFQEVDCL